MKIKRKDIYTQAHHSQTNRKRKNIESIKKNDSTYWSKRPIKLIADFLSETVESKRKWNSNIQCSWENISIENSISSKISFKNEGTMTSRLNKNWANSVLEYLDYKKY